MTSELTAGRLKAAAGSGRSALQRVVARGYGPVPPHPRPVIVVQGASVTVLDPEGARPSGLFGALPRGGLGILLPTYVARCGLPEQAAAVQHVLDRLAPVRDARPDLALTLWVGMQSDDADARAATDRVAALVAGVQTPPGVSVAGLALAGRGKLLTTNAVLGVTADLGYAGWLWVDDDVRLAPDCLVRLVTRFTERGGRGAVGARETSLGSSTAPARAMDTVTRHTTPPTEAPAAGCMLVAAEIVAIGIPPRRLTDDGFVMFELLARATHGAAPDFEVVQDAYCEFRRIGRPGDTVRRLRRSLYSHITSMADYPQETAWRYFSEYLFYGLWPLAPWDRDQRLAHALVRWWVKAVHFSWFCVVAAILAVRGLTGRPVRDVLWGDDGDFRTALTCEGGSVRGGA